jgi:hypothetical protein
VSRGRRALPRGYKFPSDDIRHRLSKVHVLKHDRTIKQLVDVLDRLLGGRFNVINLKLLLEAFVDAEKIQLARLKMDGTISFGLRLSSHGTRQKLAVLTSPIVTVLRA